MAAVRGRPLLFALLGVAAVVGSAACSAEGTGGPATESEAAADAAPADDAARREEVPPAERAPVPSPACTDPSATEVAAGSFVGATTVDRTERAYEVVVPTAHDGARPVPLVLNLHGIASPPGVQRAVSGMAEAAEERGYVVVFPRGTSEGELASWPVDTRQTDEAVASIGAVIDEVGARVCVDEARTYATGLSNGAMMASRLACDLDDRIAAVATVAGAVAPDDCDADRPVPLMAFHGTADRVLPYEGGVGPGLAEAGVTPEELEDATGATGLLGPADETLAALASRNGCAADAVDEQVAEHVAATIWSGCDDDADVVLYTIEGGGHSWPGGPTADVLAGVLGQTTDEVSANGLMWAFFRDHPLPGG